MIRLNNVNRKLQALLAGAPATTQPDVIVSYSDKNPNDETYTGAPQLTAMNGVTAVDICSAPASGVVRDVDYLSIRNNDTADVTATVRYNDNATLYKIISAVLRTGEQLSYMHGSGWACYDVNGAQKIAESTIQDIGTGDSPQFAGVNIGHASDTTIGRTSAGVANVEGDPIVTRAQNNTFSKAQRGSVTTLTDAVTIALNLAANNFYEVLLGGNRTLGVPTNIVEGQSGDIVVYQDGTGSRTLAYAWPYQFSTGTAPVLSTGKYTKDALQYKSDLYAQSTITVTIASPGVVSWTGHGLFGGQRIQLTTTGALPTGLTVDTSYYIIPVDVNSFQLATSLANAQTGTAINTSGSQSGVHTMTAATITIAKLGAIA